jgi:hypothetical protein
MTLPSPFLAGLRGPARKTEDDSSAPVLSASGLAQPIVILNPVDVARTASRTTGYRVSTGWRAGDRHCRSSLGGPVNGSNLPAISFPSAAVLLPRTDSRGLSCPLSARLGFNSVGPFKAARRLIPVRLHGASRVRQNPTPRTIEQLFHLLSFLPCYVSEHSQGANAACAKNLSRRCKQ